MARKANDKSKSFNSLAHKTVGRILMQDERLFEILKGYHVVRIADDDEHFNEKLTWCMEHCQNKFRDIRESNCRAWYFQNPQDASMFAMKWA